MSDNEKEGQDIMDMDITDTVTTTYTNVPKPPLKLIIAQPTTTTSPTTPPIAPIKITMKPKTTTTTPTTLTPTSTPPITPPKATTTTTTLTLPPPINKNEYNNMILSEMKDTIIQDLKVNLFQTIETSINSQTLATDNNINDSKLQFNILTEQLLSLHQKQIEILNQKYSTLIENKFKEMQDKLQDTIDNIPQPQQQQLAIMPANDINNNNNNNNNNYSKDDNAFSILSSSLSKMKRKLIINNEGDKEELKSRLIIMIEKEFPLELKNKDDELNEIDTRIIKVKEMLSGMARQRSAKITSQQKMQTQHKQTEDSGGSSGGVKLHHNQRNTTVASREPQIPRRELYHRLPNGQFLQLICPNCSRFEFSNVLGFLNHCRIKHNRKYANQDEAAESIGVPVNESDVPIDDPARGNIPISSRVRKRSFSSLTSSSPSLPTFTSSSSSLPPRKPKLIEKEQSSENKKLTTTSNTSPINTTPTTASPTLEGTKNTEMIIINNNNIYNNNSLSTSEESTSSRFYVKKRIIVGNTSTQIHPDHRGQDKSTHKWMIYVRGPQNEPDISYFVKKIWFYLHDSFAPNDRVEIKEKPFQLVRRGWGEFPVRIKLFFHDQRNKPIDIIHNLKLIQLPIQYGVTSLGGETTSDIDLDRLFFDKRERQLQKSNDNLNASSSGTTSPINLPPSNIGIPLVSNKTISTEIIIDSSTSNKNTTTTTTTTTSTTTTPTTPIKKTTSPTLSSISTSSNGNKIMKSLGNISKELKMKKDMEAQQVKEIRKERERERELKINSNSSGSIKKIDIPNKVGSAICKPTSSNIFTFDESDLMDHPDYIIKTKIPSEIKSEGKNNSSSKHKKKKFKPSIDSSSSSDEESFEKSVVSTDSNILTSSTIDSPISNSVSELLSQLIPSSIITTSPPSISTNTNTPNTAIIPNSITPPSLIQNSMQSPSTTSTTIKKKNDDSLMETDEIVKKLMFKLAEKYPIISTTQTMKTLPYRTSPSIGQWLEWTYGKQKSTEFRRAKIIRRFIRKKSQREVSIVGVMNWCRSHGYTPINPNPSELSPLELQQLALIINKPTNGNNNLTIPPSTILSSLPPVTESVATTSASATTTTTTTTTTTSSSTVNTTSPIITPLPPVEIQTTTKPPLTQTISTPTVSTPIIVAPPMPLPIMNNHQPIQSNDSNSESSLTKSSLFDDALNDGSANHAGISKLEQTQSSNNNDHNMFDIENNHHEDIIPPAESIRSGLSTMIEQISSNSNNNIIDGFNKIINNDPNNSLTHSNIITSPISPTNILMSSHTNININNNNNNNCNPVPTETQVQTNNIIDNVQPIIDAITTPQTPIKTTVTATSSTHHIQPPTIIPQPVHQTQSTIVTPPILSSTTTSSTHHTQPTITTPPILSSSHHNQPPTTVSPPVLSPQHHQQPIHHTLPIVHPGLISSSPILSPPTPTSLLPTIITVAPVIKVGKKYTDTSASESESSSTTTTTTKGQRGKYKTKKIREMERLQQMQLQQQQQQQSGELPINDLQVAIPPRLDDIHHVGNPNNSQQSHHQDDFNYEFPLIETSLCPFTPEKVNDRSVNVVRPPVLSMTRKTPTLFCKYCGSGHHPDYFEMKQKSCSIAFKGVSYTSLISSFPQIVISYPPTFDPESKIPNPNSISPLKYLSHPPFLQAPSKHSQPVVTTFIDPSKFPIDWIQLVLKMINIPRLKDASATFDAEEMIYQATMLFMRELIGETLQAYQEERDKDSKEECIIKLIVPPHLHTAIKNNSLFNFINNIALYRD